MYNVVSSVTDVFLVNKGRNRDLALLQIDRKIDTDIFIPICLPSNNDNFRGLNGVLIGWGSNISISFNESGVIPEILQVYYL